MVLTLIWKDKKSLFVCNRASYMFWLWNTLISNVDLLNNKNIFEENDVTDEHNRKCTVLPK